MNKSFTEFHLDETLTRGLLKLGLTEPTPVQCEAIPATLTGRDLLVSATTGSGKTLAFLLPMMQRFIQNPAPDMGTRALILVPTRELARQIEAHFLQVGSYTRLTAEVIIGGASTSHQIASLRKNPDILIATPGRLLELLERGSANLSELEVLVLDEADRILDLGFTLDVTQIIAHCNPDRQSLLFSATLNHRGLKPVTDALLRDPQTVMVDHHRSLHPNIHHQLLLADDLGHKQELLAALLEQTDADKVLVFTNTRAQAASLAGTLVARGQRTAALHGELEQRERTRVLDLLRRGEIRVLVATDLAARGLDVPGMDAVINFEIPRSGSDYLHRTGRTGRAGGAGLAISLVSANEWNRMESISRYLGLNLEQRSIPGLQAVFKGTKRGKGPKKRTSVEKHKKENAKSVSKTKDRHRDRKNIGKRRKPVSTAATDAPDAGFNPLYKKTR